MDNQPTLNTGVDNLNLTLHNANKQMTIDQWDSVLTHQNRAEIQEHFEHF